MWSDLLHRWFLSDEAKTVLQIIASLVTAVWALFYTFNLQRVTRRKRYEYNKADMDDVDVDAWMKEARRHHADSLKKQTPKEPRSKS
jgi:uncharacterized protein (DUF697 family)